MERETKQVLLPKSKSTVFIVKDLLYGESVSINEALYGEMEISIDGTTDQKPIKSSFIFEQNKSKFVNCVKKMTDKDGNDVKINEETLNTLPLADAELVLEEIDKLINDTKKK